MRDNTINYNYPESDYFKKLFVRPIFKEEEEEHWNELMNAHHYLGFRCLVGESIKYVAILDGKWVALLGWGTAAFKVTDRDTWIGWRPEIQWKRLKFITNNMRFLVLPDMAVKNLASKTLALNLKRLSKDWEEIHGHPIALAETFVDTSRFMGTCYLAAGWTILGKTKGYRRNGGKYFYHGNSKVILVKPLVKDAKYILSSDFLAPQFERKEAYMDLNKTNIKDLLATLGSLVDKRKKRGVRHKIVPILAIASCATLSGCKSYSAIGEWSQNLNQKLKKKFGCKYDYEKCIYIAPSESTLRRTLQTINGEALDLAIGQWVLSQSESKIIALDGKTLRGSKSNNRKAVHLVAAFSVEEKVVISQEAVNEKSNEISAAEPLLSNIDLKDKRVTADAMHTQTKLAKFIIILN